MQGAIDQCHDARKQWAEPVQRGFATGTNHSALSLPATPVTDTVIDEPTLHSGLLQLTSWLRQIPKKLWLPIHHDLP
jgi:hypothetical protein